ncbi:methyl-accepting chemotaxis protein [Cupriavidus sp. NPDC089707]|uniref:methyl-accepting chemotaxis protein n=1 Tax=Cupriavidus sp. NPDC089707 TaxID=3363963 RepID=UPI003830B3A1
MNNLKVSTRLMMLTGVLATLLVVIGSLGLWGINRTQQGLETVYKDRMLAVLPLAEIGDRLMRNRLALAVAVITPDAATIASSVETVESNIVEIGKLWDAYQATDMTQEEQQLARAFSKAREQFVKEGLLPTVAALQANNVDEARLMVAEKLRPLFAPVREGNRALQKLQADEAKREFDVAQERYASLFTVFIVCISAGLAFAMAFGFWLVRSIGRQLGAEPGEAAGLAQRVAAGDLSVPIALKPGDTASLMAQLKVMQESLVNVVTGVRQNAEGVAAASAQIAQGNEDLSQRTEEQASALEETSASMEELGTTVKQNADNASQANQLALGAATVAVKGGEVVGQVVDMMKSINESSGQIADIISVIDSIAFQTNILALNAAVEAARAGEQGRGFAVVAGEVRNLAQRSADAAKDIKRLITTSVERVDQGTALVDQAGATMQEIVSAINRVTGIMGEISAASVEQSAGVTQVGEAVSQMDQATQQNAALVEESAAAAENLKVQARELVQSVSVFKLMAMRDSVTRASESADAMPARAMRSTSAQTAIPPRITSKPARASIAAKTGLSHTGDTAWDSF